MIGAGAIGCLYGVRLDEAGQEVLLIHRRKGIVDSIRKKGVRIRESRGKVIRARMEASSSLSKDDNAELVLVTVKAYDTENVARRLLTSVGSEAAVLSLQNGFGNVEALSRRLGRRRVLGGTTTEGVMSIGPGSLIHTGQGRTWIGELDGRTSKRCLIIKGAFCTAGFKTQVTKNIEGMLRAKAIVNSAINPISALTRLPNGDLHSVPGLRRVVSAVVEEGIAVMRAGEISSVEPDPRPLLSKVLSSSAQNKSSMLRDIEEGKKTEIHQLNAALSLLGKRKSVPTPYNNLLTALILGLERSESQSARG